MGKKERTVGLVACSNNVGLGSCVLTFLISHCGKGKPSGLLSLTAITL